MRKQLETMTILNYVMTACFLLSLAVQYNDPDPARWMAIYGAAAVACGLYLGRRYYWPLFAAVGLVALSWAALLAPHVIGKVSIAELFESVQMKDARVEEARETVGLLIVAAWMMVLTLSSIRRAAAARAGS